MEAIPNNRLFIVDNSLAQDKDWLRELFTAMIPLKKNWVSHPILDDDEILDLAAEAGCWYVYQAIFDTSDVIRNRIQRLKDHGIGVEGTIILGTDDQDEDCIKRLVDFLLEIDLDVAEFTILTPFPHSPIRAQMEREGRILSNDWSDYTADKVVFQPKQMTPEKLQELYYYAWDTFYADGGQQLKMGELFTKGIMKEVAQRHLPPLRPAARRGASSRRRETHEPGLPRLRQPLRRPVPGLPAGDGGGRRRPRRAGARGAAVRPPRRGPDEAALGAAVARFAPDVVGISLRNIDNVDSLSPERLAASDGDRAAGRAALREATAAPVVLGGAGFSHDAGGDPRLLGADYGVVGEGEQRPCRTWSTRWRGASAGPAWCAPRPPMAGGEIGCAAARRRRSSPSTWPSRAWSTCRPSAAARTAAPTAPTRCWRGLASGTATRGRWSTSSSELRREHGVEYVFFTDSVFNDAGGALPAGGRGAAAPRRRRSAGRPSSARRASSGATGAAQGAGPLRPGTRHRRRRGRHAGRPRQGLHLRRGARGRPRRAARRHPGGPLRHVRRPRRDDGDACAQGLANLERLPDLGRLRLLGHPDPPRRRRCSCARWRRG